MDKHGIYRRGPCMADDLPDRSTRDYQRRFGTGKIGLASIIALAARENVTGDPWARIADISNFLGLNAHPSISLVVGKGWVSKRLVEVSKYAPSIGHPGSVYYIRLTPLGWEYVTDFLGVKRNVTSDQG